MALVVVTGLPASGKTRRSRELFDYLEPRLAEISEKSQGALKGRNLAIRLVSEHDFDHDREIYRDTRLEKPARGAVYAAVERYLDKNTIVICDAPNYIKGFRYQLYCTAREVGALNMTLWTIATPDQARELNGQREDGYSNQVFEELAFRYEEPNGASRWDQPLVSAILEDKTLNYGQIVDILTTQRQKKVNIGVMTMPATAANYLQVLEATTTQVSGAITTASADNAGVGGSTNIALPQDLLPLPQKDFRDPMRPVIDLPVKQITPAQMNRYRRAFVGLHRNDKAIDAKSVAGLYLLFIQTTLNA
ncbi:chromatin associated protein KTI12 [Wallemia mellicola]|uniref:Chromatin associated protein KTI12 n=1 Tax=Wallemia mellicola TaxID=1708541 RepID=A0A4V4MNP9_9BASI|nr:hypothetical protein E3Q23_04043 [Wallemia mellicola]TIB94922.1 chromatin associated protein KTI12 [Wallemia mellicola]TIC07983.1 chromatin associated protein KTI12 [Wallemia mellicola]TIC24278.1 chromatin associated protein KTI12 [Wallemia mellicola]